MFVENPRNKKINIHFWTLAVSQVMMATNITGKYWSIKMVIFDSSASHPNLFALL